MPAPRTPAQRRRRGAINMSSILVFGLAFIVLGLTAGIWWFVAVGALAGAFALAGFLRLRRGWGLAAR